MADERTATGPPPSARYAVVTAAAMSPGTGVVRSSSRARTGSAVSTPAAARANASVVTQNPPGTGSPAEISSPRFAAFPPTRGRSAARSSPRSTTSDEPTVDGAAERSVVAIPPR